MSYAAKLAVVFVICAMVGIIYACIHQKKKNTLTVFTIVCAVILEIICTGIILILLY